MTAEQRGGGVLSAVGAPEPRFEALQDKLLAQWERIGSFNRLEQTMVVVPSLSLELDLPGVVLQAYEERLMFMLLLLRKPQARIVYLSSLPITSELIDYYLGLLPGVIPGHARRRLFTLAACDSTSRPLTQKILERPRLVRAIRELIPHPDSAHLVPFITSDLERDLALRLDIPMYGADPRFAALGTKSGSRRLFAAAGVPHPPGVEGIRSLDEATAAIQRLRRAHPDMEQVIVKLDEGVSGEGNATVALAGLGRPGAAEEPQQVRERLTTMRFESPAVALDSFMNQLAQQGGVVEERVRGDELRSPSVQLRVTPVGEVELLSTHDQLLGGETGMSYLGCRFPADGAYAAAIAREARKVGERLAALGVLGRSAVDFVVVRSASGNWQPYAIELNLRKGGTTAPYLSLEFLTQGRYDAESGSFLSPTGQQKCYVADDHVESPAYCQLTPADLFDVVVHHELHFNQATQTGVVFHMLAALSERGRFGLTAVGNTHADAWQLYVRTREAVDAEARAAAREPDRPNPPS